MASSLGNVGVVTFENDQHTGALPGRLVRNPLSIGLAAGATNVPAARGDEAVQKRDLSQYAVELSRGGGASAVARVMRDDKGAATGPAEEKSKM